MIMTIIPCWLLENKEEGEIFRIEIDVILFLDIFFLLLLRIDR